MLRSTQAPDIAPFSETKLKPNLDPMTPPESTANVTRSLMERIGSAIVTGEYQCGESLPSEWELASHYNVSRTSVREAVKMLAAKGLLRSWPRRGIMVQDERFWSLLDSDVLKWTLERRFSLSLVQDFLQMRLVIESEAAAMAAKKRAATDEIERAIEMMRQAESGFGDPVTADSAFHTAVLNASGNRFFAQMSPFVSTALVMSIRLTNRIKGVKYANVDEHEAILNAIKRGFATQARSLTMAMIQEALSLIELEQRDASGSTPS